MVYIGNVEIKHKTVLAPMAGIGNSSFRKIIKKMGAGLIYAEMVSDKALFYKNKKTVDMLYMEEMERPITQQIFGSDKESFVSAAKFIYENMHPDIIDINMGCPVPKVAVRAQAGSALLKNPEKIKDIVSSVVSSVPIPVTVKIRSGWDSEHINAVEVARICEEAGASAICVHPRTRSQGYSGKADWSIIKQVKDAVSIPVIGNGDINTIYDAKRMIDETNCDLVMIGRGVLGNPWLIKQINAYLEDNVILPDPTSIERIDMCLEHLHNLYELKDEKLAVLEIRNHIAWYLKGLPNSNEIKNKIFLQKNISVIIEILNDYRKYIEDLES
ncbi:MAG: tRNA dihydrouridine synthase DusB [Tenericutes bacterium]|nr:tRNA dihydrouridine synthase DusB [Mycoplasmatota bacterium]